MAYVYLLDIYKYLEERLADASEAMGKAHGDTLGKSLQQGRIDTLIEFRGFLHEHFNPKLPRRIRATYFDKKD